ncbi:MAG: hypothetical protein DRH57_02845 [Candidatus Cloacimonadota bacterium]|nr:MAG: hypothetical protein DRH57_02845 [Candidatus Cloacimonadota bacterium]
MNKIKNLEMFSPCSLRLCGIGIGKSMNRKIVSFYLVLLAVILLNSNIVGEPRFEKLKQALIEEGFREGLLDSIYSSGKVKFYPKLLEVNVFQKSYSDYYERVPKPKNVEKGKLFYQEHKELLKKCEQETKVPASIITALLYIETNFKEYKKNNLVVNVYFSLYFADEDSIIDKNIEKIRNSELSQAEKEKIISKAKRVAKRKSKWAFKELKVLLKNFTAEELLNLYGSWAGAIGYPQFIPSSYEIWAVDGNNDGKIDLFDFDDAIYSIANYLNSNGWKENLTDKQKKAVIHTYNHNWDYVTAVLKYAENLEKLLKNAGCDSVNTGAESIKEP